MIENCSCKIVYSTAVAVDGTTSLQITIPTQTFNNGERFGLRIVQAIPSNGTPLPVNIVMGTTNYPLQKPLGNYVMSDQLRTNVCYCLVAGGNPWHFTVRRPNQLCGTTFTSPQIIGAA